MLDVARQKVPTATFDQAPLEALPYADASFELATISLALCHLADPTTAITELGRVLVPGGHLVIADPHPMGGPIIGGQAFYGGITPGRPMTWVRNHFHLTSTWLQAFATAGLTFSECIEVPMTEPQLAATPAMAFYPDAVRSGFAGLASLWVWVVVASPTPDGSEREVARRALRRAVILVRRDRALRDAHLVDLVGAVGESRPTRLLQHAAPAACRSSSRARRAPGSHGR